MNWGAALAALAAGVLINEVSDISPWIGQRLARCAATLRYGRCERARTRSEEWCALLEERPGKFFRLMSGLLFFLDSLPRAAWRLIMRSQPGEASIAFIPDAPHRSLGLRQTAALLTLMAVGKASVGNRELRESYGIEISGNERRALNELGLVASRKQGPFFVHELTEQGWAWCAREIAQSEHRAGGPTRSSNAALLALTAGLNRYMDRNKLTLADIFVEDYDGRDEPGRQSRNSKRWFNWRRRTQKN